MALYIFVIFHLLLEVKSQGLPQANLTIFPTFATDEEEVQMVCGGHENQHMSECMFFLEGQENFLKPSHSCNLSITGANLIAWSQVKEISHINISCYYTVHALGKDASSPHSNSVSIRVRALAAMSSLPPITEGSPARMTPNGTSQGNLFTVSTSNTTTTLAVTSSTEIITDSITNMSSLSTHDSHSLTDPANVFPLMTEGPEIKKYSNTKMFFFIAVAASGGGIILTGLVGMCLYGCTRKSKAERIWIEFNSKKQGLSLPTASSETTGEEDAVLYSSINFMQPPSQPPGNREESMQNEVEPNHLYCTILNKPAISSDSRSVYSQLKLH